MKKRKLIELIVRDDQMTEQLNGVGAISLVEFPAIEENFIAFSHNKNYSMAKMEIEKKMLTGPALIPDKKIFRYNEETNEEYDVYFSAETIEKCMVDFMRCNRNHETTFEHTSPIKDVFIVETWIVSTDNDRARDLGYDVPNGTWMVSMKVDNDEVWNKVKDGTVRGFSIEGMFTEMLIDMAKVEKDPDTVYLMWDINNTENPCPACLKLHGFIMKEEEWKGLGPREASSNGRFSTFCEDACQCQLIRATKGYYDAKRAVKMIAYLKEVREIDLMSDKMPTDEQFCYVAEQLDWILKNEESKG